MRQRVLAYGAAALMVAVFIGTREPSAPHSSPTEPSVAAPVVRASVTPPEPPTAAIDAAPTPDAPPTVSMPPSAPTVRASATCGRIEGSTARDADNAEIFCRSWVPAQFKVNAVTADTNRIWISVPQFIATALNADDLMAEQLVRGWMAKWRGQTGESSVIVRVMWGEIELAKGQPTMFSGDEVKLRR